MLYKYVVATYQPSLFFFKVFLVPLNVTDKRLGLVEHQ